MKWIELIIVRAADSERQTYIRRITRQLMQGDRPDGLKQIIPYRNAFVETDVCINLQWEIENKAPAKSDIGIGLAAALEEFGRIHHTIWIKDVWDET